MMYLCRIKNPEQLKRVSPGEYGKLLGLDRIPQSKCLRKKLKEIVKQNKSSSWNTSLANDWTIAEENEFYYIDGHVQKYSGYQANLGKKHVAGQKLCLPGIQEFWVNNKEGLPYFYVSGEVNEKLLEMLSNQIVPNLLKEIQPRYTEAELMSDSDLPRFTIVFDREAYSPVFFKKLWKEHRVAVITYRKNVKDLWPETDFNSCFVNEDDVKTEMRLAEKPLIIQNFEYREIRRLTNQGHQTSIMTTHYQLEKKSIAIYMFSRWTQENYFKYLKQDYDFDRLMQYTVESIDCDFVIVNPEYNNMTYKLKKIREKISRRKAILYELERENVRNDLSITGKSLVKQAKEKEELDILLNSEQELLEKRKSVPYKIKIDEMPENSRYNKLHVESKHFQNIIKMICYRSETSFANMLLQYYAKGKTEKRALAKSIINTRGDIIADYINNSLTIKLYSQSNPRMNRALEMICDILTDTNSLYPGTNLKLIYKIATSEFTKGQEF